MAAHQIRAVAAPARFPKALPVVVFGTAIAGVATYVRSQLVQESAKMDRFFSKYNSPESEASRQRTFNGNPDPRTNIFNVLSWK